MLSFVGANPRVRPEWQEPTSETIGPFTDPQLQEKIGRPVSATLHYRDVWPGIDLLYTITGDQLRSTFLVKPGANPNQIQFAYHGATAARRTEAGPLEVSTSVGSFAEDTPVAYQESLHLARLAHLRDGVSGEMPGVYQDRDARRVGVDVAYTLQPSGDTSIWGIHVGAYDPNTPLIIDRIVRYPGSTEGSNTDADADRTANRSSVTHATAFSTPPSPPYP